jgi:hypothetical protein
MTRRLQALLIAAAVLMTVVPSAAQKKAAKDQKYDVSFVFEETTYNGTMTLTVEGTAVSGTMAISDPFTVTGDVAGTLKTDELALDYPFSMAGDQPCTGQVTIAAKMTADRASATGTAHATGCGDHPVDGTFALKKSADKPAKF